MKALDPQYSQVYDELTELRGSAPAGHLFSLAIAKRAVGEYIAREIDLDDLSGLIDDLADTLRKNRDIHFETRNLTSGEVSQREPIDNRQDAVQRILALEIAADQAVVSFRADNLETGLVGFDEVAAWVERTAHTDGQPTVLITLPQEMLDKVASSNSQAFLDRLPGYSERHDELQYVTGGVHYTLSVPVRFDGVLDHLSLLSKRIARWYEWDEAAAATFILTGLHPAPRGANARKVEPWPWPVPRRRIALDVPLSTTPDEVANLYQRLRDEMLTGDQRKGRRSLIERTADLAVFAAEHSSGHTWEEARAIWNRRHKETPSHLASNSAQFIRDSRAAYERVTGERLDWEGKQSSVSHSRSQPKET